MSDKPIVVKPDLITVEQHPFTDTSLLYVCKLLAHECTSFLFRNNTITSLFKIPKQGFRRYDEPAAIAPRFISFYKDIIIDCNRDCWNLDWYEKVTEALNKLVHTEALIATLTLAVVPRRAGMSSTALGIEASPLTFADFLWHKGDLMDAILTLAPKKLIVVMKKTGMKSSIEVDLTHLRDAQIETGPMATEESVCLARERGNVTRKQLMALKKRFEAIFDNHEKATQEGLCGWMSQPPSQAVSSNGDSPDQNSEPTVFSEIEKIEAAWGEAATSRQYSVPDAEIRDSLSQDQPIRPLKVINLEESSALPKVTFQLHLQLTVAAHQSSHCQTLS